MPFYPEAMNKARLRVRAVRLNQAASEGDHHETAFLAGRYKHEMQAVGIIDLRDDARLELLHSRPPNVDDVECMLDVSDSLDLLMARGPVSVN